MPEPITTTRGLLTEVIAFSVGDRISSSGAHGTVKYIGPVESYDGNWLGVDWDDVSRGKHDGCLRGQLYFKARYKTSGSFLRPEKALRGRSFLDALRERYCSLNSGQASTDHVLIGSKLIEMVGMEKIAKQQSQYQKLTRVVLTDMLISHAGDVEEIRAVCPNIVELDLSKNLISSWQEVVRICCALDKLKILNLSCNRITLPTEDWQLTGELESIRTLILSDMELDWDYVMNCAAIASGLSELCLCRNAISTLVEPYSKGLLKHLRSLDLEANPITDWDEILKLGTLPKLEVLNLNGTGIAEICIPDTVQTDNNNTLDTANFFPSLKTLHCSRNKITDWSSISELDKLPVLQHLLLNENPVVKSDTPQTVRQLFIAKLSKICLLDRVQITPQERRGAEIDYLKRYGPAWIDAKKNNDSKMELFLKEHPKFPKLTAIYGEPEPAELVPTSNVIVLLELTVKFPEQFNVPAFTRKFPERMTLQKFTTMISRMSSVRFDPRSLVLTYECPDRPGLKIPMPNPMRELFFYNLRNGDTIWVENAEPL